MADIIDVLEFPVTQNYSPEVPIEIIGILNDTVKRVAIVDTGATIFMQMPLSLGISAHLRLWASKPATLADKSSVTNLICFGTIKFAGKDIMGLIRLSETNDECILGMDFLNELGMDFTYSPSKKRAIFYPIKKEAEVPKAEVKQTEGEAKKESGGKDKKEVTSAIVGRARSVKSLKAKPRK